jgi:hypothetical protein
METPPVPPRRPIGRRVLAVVYVALALSAWWQVVNDFTGGSDEPRTLTGLQLIIGALAATTAWGSWIGARWAPRFALLYGVVTGGMVVALGPMLDLPPESRRGLWLGGAMVLAFGLVTAWWLQRTLQRERARAMSHIVGFD